MRRPALAKGAGRLSARPPGDEGAADPHPLGLHLHAPPGSFLVALLGALLLAITFPATRNGRAREAEPLIRRAVDLDPLLVQARRNLVPVLDDQHRPDEARAALAAAIQATGRQAQYEDLAR
jgi:hypothetical protein